MPSQRGNLFNTFLTGKPVSMSRDDIRDLDLQRPKLRNRRRGVPATNKRLRRAISLTVQEKLPREEALGLLATLAKQKQRPVRSRTPTSPLSWARFLLNRLLARA